METHQILQSSLLDILFSGKNKAYGAYQLRKTYNKRMYLAMSGTATLISIFFLIRILTAQANSNVMPPFIQVDSSVLNPFQPDKPIPPPPPPPVQKLPQAASAQFTKIAIVKDDQVLIPPPDKDQLDKARIDIKTQTGVEFDGTIMPPSEETSTQVIGAPVNKKDSEDSVRIIVEVQASFPGGDAAWGKYVRRAVESELDEFTENDFGKCLVRFVVDKEGNVSDVHATTMKGTKLAEIAVNAIRKGPKWIPAQQNGHYVSAYRLQPVTLLNLNQ